MIESLKLKQFLDIEKFTSEVSEDMSDLTEAMRTQTARCAFYGMMHAQAKKQLSDVNRVVSAIEASLRTKHRKEMQTAAVQLAEEEGSKPERITAEMVNSALYGDPKMLKVLRIQSEAEEIEATCKVAYNAFKTRESMLISLGNMTRDMMKSQLRIMGNEAKSSIEGYRARRRERETQTDKSHEHD